MTSAGILLYRLAAGAAEVLIAHMGGPFWAAKDDGAWSIPKGEYDGTPRPRWMPRSASSARSSGSIRPTGSTPSSASFAYSSGKRVTVFVADGAGLRSLTDRVRRVRAGVAATVGQDGSRSPRSIVSSGCR